MTPLHYHVRAFPIPDAEVCGSLAGVDGGCCEYAATCRCETKEGEGGIYGAMGGGEA